MFFWGCKLESIKKSDLSTISYEFRELLSVFEEQFEDHLIAINENTSEILSVYECLSELDAKLEKMSERFEHVENFLQKLGLNIEQVERQYNIEPLTKKEKEIFLIIYTLSDSTGFVSYAEISKGTNLPEDLVCLYITGMMQKGIPFSKKYINNKAYIKLDDAFKERQAKENILKIEQRTITI